MIDCEIHRRCEQDVWGDYISYSVAEMGLRVGDWIKGNRERRQDLRAVLVV